MKHHRNGVFHCPGRGVVPCSVPPVLVILFDSGRVFSCKEHMVLLFGVRRCSLVPVHLKYKAGAPSPGLVSQSCPYPPLLLFFFFLLAPLVIIIEEAHLISLFLPLQLQRSVT